MRRRKCDIVLRAHDRETIAFSLFPEPETVNPFDSFALHKPFEQIATGNSHAS